MNIPTTRLLSKRSFLFVWYFVHKGEGRKDCPITPQKVLRNRQKTVWGRVLQGTWSACVWFLNWLASRLNFKHHEPSSFNQCGVYMFAVSSFHLVGICVLQKNLGNVCQVFGLSWWLSDKESSCNAGATGDMGLIPGSGRSLGRGHSNPLQYFCLENPVDRGARQATVLGGHKELDTTEAA